MFPRDAVLVLLCLAAPATAFVPGRRAGDYGGGGRGGRSGRRSGRDDGGADRSGGRGVGSSLASFWSKSLVASVVATAVVEVVGDGLAQCSSAADNATKTIQPRRLGWDRRRSAGCALDGLAFSGPLLFASSGWMQRVVWPGVAPFLFAPVLAGLFIAITAAVEGRPAWNATRLLDEYGPTLVAALDTNLALLPATLLAARFLPPAAAAAAYRGTAIATVYSVSFTSHAMREPGYVRPPERPLISSSPVPLAKDPERSTALNAQVFIASLLCGFFFT